MAGRSIGERSATDRFGLTSCAGIALALLTASLPAPASIVLAAGAPDQAAPLDRLSITLSDLKSNLIAIRQDLEGMRAATDAAAPPALDALCEALPADPADELKVAREVERLRSEGMALRSRIDELEKMIDQAHTREVVGALVKSSPISPIESAAAAELDRPLRLKPELQAPAAAIDSADLQLRAELALAQLKIAELTDELHSTRFGQGELEAELRSLRSLTDAKIKHFMGWE